MSDYLALLAARSRGTLVTLKRDGRPQVSNVDFYYDPATQVVRFSTTADRAKVPNLRRDPRVSLHVTTPEAGAYAVVEGIAEVSPVAADPDDKTVDELVDVFRGVQGEHPDWDDYRRAMVADRRVVVRFHIDRSYGYLPA